MSGRSATRWVFAWWVVLVFCCAIGAGCSGAGRTGDAAATSSRVDPQPASTAAMVTAPPTAATAAPTTTVAPTTVATTVAPSTTVAPTTLPPVTTTEVTAAPRTWTLDEVKVEIGRGRVWFDETSDRTCPGYDLPRPVVRTSDDNDDAPHFEVRVFESAEIADQYFNEWVRLIADSGMRAVACRGRSLETAFSAGLAQPNPDGSVTLSYRFSLLEEVRLSGVLHRCGNVVVQTVPASDPARLC